MRALFTDHGTVGALIGLGIVVGFFHGWLKLEIRHPAIVFAFDAFFLAGLALLVRRHGLKRLIPDGEPMFRALKVYLWACVLYALVPWGPSLMISLASLRGWAFAPLTLILGYYVFRNEKQVEGLVVLLCVLSVVVAVYGLNQDMEKVTQRLEEDPYFAARYFNTFYWTPEAGGQLRIFSTFVSAAGLGSALALSNVLIYANFINRPTSTGVRLFFVVAFLLFIYTIFLTGSRSAMVNMILGIVIVVTMTRVNSRSAVMAIVLLLVGLTIAARFASIRTEGGSVSRYGDGLSPENILLRNQIPITLGLTRLAENPLGRGLGRSGHGVPFFMLSQVDETFILIDGDIGRLMVDMGVPGLIIYCWFLKTVGIGLYRRAKGMQGNRQHTVCVIGLAAFCISVVSIPSGSPYLGIPNGVLTWLLVGAVLGIGEADRAPVTSTRGRGWVPSSRFR